MSAARLYDLQEHENERVPTLGGFLETASLSQDIDSLDDASGAVTLMTMHAAKGLEFPVVYIIAVEQNLIPHERSLRENDRRQIEEERRLLFVGITRAEEKLVLTQTLRREVHGRSVSTITSDFYRELIVELRDCTDEESFFSNEVEHDEANVDGDDAALGQATRDDHQAGIRSTPRREPKPKKKPRGITSLDGRLTTGAALQSGADAKVELRVGLSVGMQVRHPRYGRGTVVDVSGMARMRTVIVEFEQDQRRESFIEAKSPLQPIGLH